MDLKPCPFCGSATAPDLGCDLQQFQWWLRGIGRGLPRLKATGGALEHAGRIMTKEVYCEWGGHNNPEQVLPFIVDAFEVLKVPADTPMMLKITLNGARALASQNRFNVSTFDMLRKMYPQLLVVLCSCEPDDANGAFIQVM